MSTSETFTPAFSSCKNQVAVRAGTARDRNTFALQILHGRDIRILGDKNGIAFRLVGIGRDHLGFG